MRQRIEALKNEFAQATAKLASLNQQIKTAIEKYSLLSEVITEFEEVNTAIEAATVTLSAIHDFARAQTKALLTTAIA